MKNQHYRFPQPRILHCWKELDQLDELLLMKNQDFPTFEAFVSKLEQITLLVREKYPKYLNLDHPTILKQSFIYIYEKFDAIYRQELSTLQNLYQNTYDPTQEAQSKQRISTLLKYEMTVPKIAKHPRDVEYSPDLVNLLQVLFHDTELLDKLLLTLYQKAVFSEPHSEEIIQLKTKVLNFIVPFFQNASFILRGELGDDVEILTEKILSQIKELLKNSTSLAEKEITSSVSHNLELALKSAPNERKTLFSQVLTSLQEFSIETAYYELLGHLSLLNYCCDSKLNLTRLQAVLSLYAVDLGEFCPDNQKMYDSSLLQKFENRQPEPIKSISSSLQRTLGMLLQEEDSFSEGLLELLELQLLVVNSSLEIAKSRESDFDLFLEGKFCICSQLYEFIKDNREKLGKISSKHQFLLCQYDSLLGEWIEFLRNLQGQKFLINKEDDQDRVISKYQGVHLKYLKDLLLLLTAPQSRFLQENIIELLNKAVKLDSSYLSKLDLKTIFYLAEQQILQEFFPNLNTCSSTTQVFPILLRVIESCFSFVLSDLLSSAENAFLIEMQNSRLFKELLALYEQNSKIVSNLKDSSKQNSFLSIIHFLMQLVKLSPEIYLNDESFRPKFNLIMKDLLSSELQSLDPVQYSTIATDLMNLFYKIKFFANLQDQQTIFLYLKFCFFQSQYKIVSGAGVESQYLRNAFQEVIESYPEHKTLLVEMMISLLNALERKVQDPSVNLWEELRKIEMSIIEKKPLGSQRSIPFIFPIDSKIFESINLKESQDLVKTMTYKSLLMSSLASSNFTPEHLHLVLDIMKATSRIVMSPLLIFMTPFCFWKTRIYLNDLHHYKDGQLNAIIESLMICINQTFETFKLNDKNLFSEISISKISAILLEISGKDFIPIEAIPRDMTWREAVIASLALVLRLYGDYFKIHKPYLHVDFGPKFYQEFLKANQNLKAFFENHLKEFSRQESHWNDSSQDWIQALSIFQSLFQSWGGFCYVIMHRYSFKAMVGDIYKEWISGLDFSSSKTTATFRYNIGILNCFLNIVFQDEYEYKRYTLVQILSTTEILQHLLSLLRNQVSLTNDDNALELYFLNNQCPHFFKRFYDPSAFHTAHLENTNYETQTARNFAEIKQVLSNKNLGTVINTHNKPLIENINRIIECCFDMYRVYDNYSGNQTKKLENELARAKAKKCQEIEEEEDLCVGMFADPDEDQDENYPEPDAQQNEEEDFFGGFNVEDEFVQGEEGDAEEVDKIEKASRDFLDKCKDEVESFLQSCLPNLLFFTELDDRLLNFKINSSTIPKTFWLNQYDSLYKTTLLCVAGLLNDPEMKTSLEKEAAIIHGNPLDLDIFAVKSSSIPAQDELTTLKLLYTLMAKLFTSTITRKLSFSSDCIHGLILVTNSKLKEIVKNFALLKEETYFFCDLTNFLHHLAKLATHLIVTTVSKTSCIVNNNDSSFNCFLLLALELIENSLLIHEIAVRDFNVGLLEQEYGNFDPKISFATVLIQFANVTLAANKNLRISLIEKGLLERFLTAKRFTLWTRKEAEAILSLFAIILEDCLPFETQVELVIKDFINEKNQSELLLNNLLNFSKFAPFKDHPRSFDPIKTYVFVSTKNIERIQTNVSQLTLKDLEIHDFIGKTFLTDYTQGAGNLDKIDAVEYLQRAVSPLAQKSIQTLLRAFTQNLAFEKESIRLYSARQQKPPLKEIKSVIELVASIMHNFPYLTPYIVFQGDDSTTTLDGLLTVALERDGESALALVGSLLKNQNLFVAGSEEQLKNVFLLKILGIINNVLDMDSTQREAFSSIETTSTRFHIAQVLAFINKQVHSEEGFDNKEKLNDLVAVTTQKLFKDIKNAFKLIAGTSSYISELSQILNGSMAGLVTPKNTEEYISFLKAIEKENHSPQPIEYDCDKFNQLIFSNKEITFQDIPDNCWTEEELKKYETIKFYMIANIENKSDLTLDFPLNGDTYISDKVTFAKLRENLKNQSEQHLLYFKRSHQGLSQVVDYLEYYKKQSPIFSQMPQSFRERLDPRLNDYFKKLQILPSLNAIPFANLKISTCAVYSAFLQEEQAKLEKILKENPISKKEEDIQIKEKVVISKEEDVRDGNLDPDRYQEYDSEGNLRVEYFVREMENEKRPFELLVNKAVQNARRLKEMIQLEKVYKKMVHNEEPSNIKEMVSDFTKNLTDFDRNILYTALGKEIRSCLSPKSQAEIKVKEKQLKAIKANYYDYLEANAKLLEKRKKEPGYKPSEVPEEGKDYYDPYETDLYYDEFDYDDNFRFLQDTQKNEQIKQEDFSDDESVPVSEQKEDLEIIKTIRSFKLDDMAVLELCMPFYCDYSKSTTASSNPMAEFSTFLNNTLFKNPANELKILDTLLFILYTPELTKYTDGLPSPLKSQLRNSPPQLQIIAKNIIEHLDICLKAPIKSFIFLTPVTYLNKFGNQLLINLKEKTGFYRKTQECYSILDIILQLLEHKSIIQDEQNIQKILEIVKNILSSSNRIALGRGNPNAVLVYKNYLSRKSLNLLFNLISSDEIIPPLINKSFSDLMESFKSQPKLLISFQDDLMNIFSSNAGSLTP